MSKITALVDGSLYGDSVCDLAAWAAARKQTEVQLVHVIGRGEAIATSQNLSGSIGLGARTALLEELSALDAENARLGSLRGRALLQGTAERMKANGINDVQLILRSGDLLETVKSLEPETDLLIVGKRGEAADFAKGHLGSNLERVVRVCTKPVLVAARAFHPIHRFAIAFDGGASALKAVDHISRSHLFAGLACHLVMVGVETEERLKSLNRAKDQLVASGYTVTAAYIQGQPETVIAAELTRSNSQMLVMGAYSHSKLKTMLIGSTTSQMIQSCTVPVMLFR